MHATLSEPEQRALLAGVARGERQAFERLYARFYQPLLGFASRIVRDDALAEEIVDDSMFELYRQAARFRGDSKLSTWLFGIARLRALTALRERSGPPAVGLEEASEVVEPAPGPQRHAVQAETARAIATALSALPVEQREAVDLVLYHGFTYEEASAVLHCPINTVKTRVFHARRKLRETLAALREEDDHGNAD